MCPCVKFAPENEPRFDEARYDTEFTEVIENGVIRKLATCMMNQEVKPPEESEQGESEVEEESQEPESKPQSEPEPQPQSEPEVKKEPSHVVVKTHPHRIIKIPPCEPNEATPNRYYLTGSPLIPLGDTVVVDIKPDAGKCVCARDKTVMYMEPLVHKYPQKQKEPNYSTSLTQIYKDHTFESSEESCVALPKYEPPPPDIQVTIDKLKNAQPRRKTPGFPARNQRYIDPKIEEKRTEHVDTHKFGPDFKAPVVQYKESFPNLHLLGSSTEAGGTYLCDRPAETETILTHSQTIAESDITMDSNASTPLAEISQVKGTDLKWKIIIKEHKGKKEKKQHGPEESDNSS